MYIVNAGSGFRKMLWPAAQKFIDPKTIAKIKVKNITMTELVIFHMLVSCRGTDLHSFPKFSDS